MNRMEAINKLGSFTVDPFDEATPNFNKVKGFIVNAKMKNIGDILITSINDMGCESHYKSHPYFMHPKDAITALSIKLKVYDSFNAKPLTFFPLYQDDKILEILVKDAYTPFLKGDEYKRISELKGFNNIEKMVKERKKSTLVFPNKDELRAMLLFDDNLVPLKESERMIASSFIKMLPELFYIKQGFSEHFTAEPTRYAHQTYGLKHDIHFMNFFDFNIKLEELMEEVEFDPVVVDIENLNIFKPNPIYEQQIVTEPDIYKATKIADALYEGLNFNDRYDTVIKILRESFSDAMVGALLDQILAILKQQYIQNGGYTYLHKIADGLVKQGVEKEKALDSFGDRHPKMSLLKDEFIEVYEDAAKEKLDATP